MPYRLKFCNNQGAQLFVCQGKGQDIPVFIFENTSKEPLDVTIIFFGSRSKIIKTKSYRFLPKEKKLIKTNIKKLTLTMDVGIDFMTAPTSPFRVSCTFIYDLKSIMGLTITSLDVCFHESLKKR
jgi:hypothetical protein